MSLMRSGLRCCAEQGLCRMRQSACTQTAARSRALRPGGIPCRQSLQPARLTQRSLSACAAAGTEQASASPAQSSSGRPEWDIKMLYDGDCPLCMREVNMLRKRDAQQNKICFVDISNDNFRPEDNNNISYEQAMGTIHGVLPDGRVITNVEVFRKLYEAVGLGWVYAPTRLGPVGKAADAVYSVWAKYRMQITGRPDLAQVLQDHNKKTCRQAGNS